MIQGKEEREKSRRNRRETGFLVRVIGRLTDDFSKGGVGQVTTRGLDLSKGLRVGKRFSYLEKFWK